MMIWLEDSKFKVKKWIKFELKKDKISKNIIEKKTNYY